MEKQDKEQTADEREIATLNAKIQAANTRATAARASMDLAHKRLEAVRAERDADDAETRAALVKEHGAESVAFLATRFGLIAMACRPGSGAAYLAWSSSKKTDNDDERFATQCLAHPSKEEFQKIVLEQPAVIGPLGVMCLKLYGWRAEEASGK